jgi:hypothetical protein
VTQFSTVQFWGLLTAAGGIAWLSLLLRIGTMRADRSWLEQRINEGFFGRVLPSSNRELFDRDTYSPRGQRLLPWLILVLVLAIVSGVGLLIALI